MWRLARESEAINNIINDFAFCHNTPGKNKTQVNKFHTLIVTILRKRISAGKAFNTSTRSSEKLNQRPPSEDMIVGRIE